MLMLIPLSMMMPRMLMVKLIYIVINIDVDFDVDIDIDDDADDDVDDDIDDDVDDDVDVDFDDDVDDDDDVDVDVDDDVDEDVAVDVDDDEVDDDLDNNIDVDVADAHVTVVAMQGGGNVGVPEGVPGPGDLRYLLLRHHQQPEDGAGAGGGRSGHQRLRQEQPAQPADQLPLVGDQQDLLRWEQVHRQGEQCFRVAYSSYSLKGTVSRDFMRSNTFAKP